MKSSPKLYSALLFTLSLLAASCHHDSGQDQQKPQIIFEKGSYPYATLWQGNYYYTMQLPSADSIILYSSKDPSRIADGKRRCIWHHPPMQHIWSPELHRLNSKWYLYFEADDGNTDNHQLYVLENASDDPMKGEFTLKGAIRTNDEWNFGLHPTSIVVRGRQYLLWSGWQNRRSETETQCIYIAEMKNPWTLDSERILISKPDLEWERQWVNMDGQRSNYPIFVNENPEAAITQDGRHVCVFYSASGIWTEYNTLGMLYANADADLLDPHSWTKVQEPVQIAKGDTTLFGCSNISLTSSPNSNEHFLFYEAKWQKADDLSVNRGILLQTVSWNKDGFPDFCNIK
ncbi:MAG: family 43 glycosylhydrolase [Prevotella sp.]|jgi:GH43 family beta-xylosidase